MTRQFRLEFEGGGEFGSRDSGDESNNSTGLLPLYGLHGGLLIMGAAANHDSPGGERLRSRSSPPAGLLRPVGVPSDYLDDATGATITRVDQPFVLFSDDPARAANARDYISRGAAGGQPVRQALLVAVARPLEQHRPRRVRRGRPAGRTSRRVQLIVDGEPMELDMDGACGQDSRRHAPALRGAGRHRGKSDPATHRQPGDAAQPRRQHRHSHGDDGRPGPALAAVDRERHLDGFRRTRGGRYRIAPRDRPRAARQLPDTSGPSTTLSVES